MKKGYVVIALGYKVELVEVAVTGTLTDDELEDGFVIDKQQSKAIWAANGKPSVQPYLANVGRFSTYWGSTAIRDDVIFDLDDAKKMVKDILLKRIAYKQKTIAREQKELDILKQPIDWDSFPKDEYISPFTGKKT